MRKTSSVGARIALRGSEKSCDDQQLVTYFPMKISDQLVDNIVNAPNDGPETSIGVEHFPTAEDPSVRLVSIEKPEHVNALASDLPLTFELNGLTIIYGDNGSGKSGYARLLKRITRSRHQEEVLSDVFRDKMMEKPTANLSVRIGDKNESLSWPRLDPFRAATDALLLQFHAGTHTLPWILTFHIGRQCLSSWTASSMPVSP